jgi:hypothetical protein
MAVEVHVQGQIEPGHLADFREALERYAAFARDNGYAEPRVLFGLSGKMNTVRLIYTYADLNGYEEHEVRTLTDRGYAEVGQKLGFTDGSIRYELYRQI